MSYQVELFQSLIEDFLQGEAALVTSAGDVLAIRGKSPETFGTLQTAAILANQYLRLQEGDIAILNDPYSGGSLLSEMTFIAAISEDIIWVSRRQTQKHLHLGQNIETEGLRIPPTPIRQNQQINETILQAMQNHPACPPDFEKWVAEQIHQITSSSKKLLDTLEFSGFEITDSLVANYLEISRSSATQKIAERSSGDARVDIYLDTGELLRLNLEIHEGKIILDFSGSSATKTTSLTEAAVFGACFYSISQFYGFQSMANSGSFSSIQVIKPLGCWLVGKYPASTFRGMTCGIAAIQTAIDLALNSIQTKSEKGLNCYCPIFIEARFGKQTQLLEVAGGQGGSLSAHGEAARLSGLSIEKWEKTFPLKFLRAGHRQSLGGKGKFNGGRGLILKFEVQDDFEMSWLTDLTKQKPKLTKNCSHGDSGEIILERNGEVRELPPEGQQKFSKGDVISICSGSGGGYGREATLN